MRYMLFLQKADLAAEGFPDTLVAHRLVGNWKGIFSLDPNAVETRAVYGIERQHGVKIHDARQEFVEAMKASFYVAGDDKKQDDPEPENLSEHAQAVYDALELHMHEKKDE